MLHDKDYYLYSAVPMSTNYSASLQWQGTGHSILAKSLQKHEGVKHSVNIITHSPVRPTKYVIWKLFEPSEDVIPTLFSLYSQKNYCDVHIINPSFHQIDAGFEIESVKNKKRNSSV